MSSDNLLEKVKKLREITGVGFKDCKSVIDETNGDVEKSIELLRKKGIAKAGKRMGRTAAEGLVCIFEKDNEFSMIEINSETDFVAKNNQFINFVEEITEIGLLKKGNMDNILLSKMKNKSLVKDNLVELISKIGEKITIRRSSYLSKTKLSNFSYTHSSLKKNVGKLGVLLSIDTTKNKNEINDFFKIHKKCIIKPLFGNGGKDIFFSSFNDPNLNVIIEKFLEEEEHFIIQKFIRNV